MKLEPKCEQFLLLVGKRLRKIRKQKGWTLEEAEQRGWPSWRHLQKIESGKNITLVTLWKLSRLYKIQITDILIDK